MTALTTLHRLCKHLGTGHLCIRRYFPKPVLTAIEAAVHECESGHPGEIRFAVEAALHPGAVLRGCTPRQRAVEAFSQLRVWDTEHNNGVLVYVLLADRAVEIVADRGVAGERVAPREWDDVCRAMESKFRTGHFEEGAVAGIHAIAGILARHPPGLRSSINELPDAPVVM